MKTLLKIEVLSDVTTETHLLVFRSPIFCEFKITVSIAVTDGCVPNINIVFAQVTG